MFDLSKIKRFDLKDLAGRTVKVDNFESKEGVLTMAIDLKTQEYFVLAHQHKNEVSPE